MKKILLVLCLIITQFSISQEVDFNRERLTLTMDNEVIPIVEEFITEGQKRGFYLRFFLMEKVDEIFFLKDFGTGDDPRLGTVGNNYRSIYLSPKLKNNPILLKVTIFHEIGHIIKFNGDHSCFNCHDIMSEYAPDNLEPYTNTAFWQHTLDNYFAWLNNS